MHWTDGSRSSPAPAAGSVGSTRSLFASEGAKVVVNDLGGDMQGGGADATPAPADGRRHPRHGRRGGRQRRERRRLGRRAAARRAGRRHVRRPPRAREQRRHPARPRHRQHDRGRVGQRRSRAPEGTLPPDPLRRRLLARADEGGPGGQRRDRPHDVDVGTVREPGTGELRLGEVGDRDPLAGDGEGARALRRAGERDRTGRAHAAHAGDAGTR